MIGGFESWRHHQVIKGYIIYVARSSTVECVLSKKIIKVNQFALNNFHVIDFVLKQGSFSRHGLQGFA